MIQETTKKGTWTWDAMRQATSQLEEASLNETQIAAVLDEMPTVYPTGRMWTPTLSEMRSQLLAYVGARYGSDTQQTVERTLSEYTEMVSHTLTISSRQKIALDISQQFDSHGLSERDRLLFRIGLLNHAGMGRVVWDAEITPDNKIVVRARLNR